MFTLTDIKLVMWSLAIALFAAIAPIHSVLMTVGFLIFADLVTGVWAAYKRGEKITSARLRDTVTKLFVYHIVLISGFFFQRDLMSDWIPIVKIAGSMIGIVEIKSLLENGETILGQPIFKRLIKVLGSKSTK